MYVPLQFQEQRVETLHQLIHTHPLGTLVTVGADGLSGDHLPFEIDVGPTPFGTLRTHVARNNPLWKEASPDVDSLVVFQGAQSYISPSWYATKQDDSRVMPTYNYMVVHGYGRLRVIEDRVWLRALLERLTSRFESTQSRPWKMADAPADYMEKMLGAIIGIEIPMTRMIGKWKVSQNQPQRNRASVEQVLRERGDANATAMADAVSVQAP